MDNTQTLIPVGASAETPRKKGIKKLITLTAMQLKDRYDLSFLKNKQKLTFKIVFTIIGLAIFTAAIYVGFAFSINLHLFSLSMRLPGTVMIFFFTVMQLFATLSCTAGLTKKLYYSGDNKILLTYPVPANTVFFSKLIVFYINELKRNITFMMPIFLAFGIVNKLSLWFYPIFLLSFLFTSLLPVMLGAILSIPAKFLADTVRRFLPIQIILILLAAAAGVFLVVVLASAIPTNVNLIQEFPRYTRGLQNFLKGFQQAFLPYAFLTEMIIGKVIYLQNKIFTLQGLATFGILLAILAAAVALIYFLIRPFYFRMASGESGGKNNAKLRPKKNKASSPFAASVKKEATIGLRNTTQFVGIIVTIFVAPLALFFLNKIFAAMDTRLLGKNMTISFSMLILLLLIHSFNTKSASVFSSEGKTGYLLRTNPVSSAANVSAKLMLNFLISTIAIAASAAVLFFSNSMTRTDSVCLFFVAALLNAAHMLWSAQLDVLNPQHALYQNGDTAETNPNETKSTVLGFLIAFIAGGFSLFLFYENYSVAWAKLIAIAAGFLAIRLVLFILNVKVYFKHMFNK